MHDLTFYQNNLKNSTTKSKINKMSEEWCCEKLQNLKIKENRLNTLEEIRVRLTEAPNLEERVTNRLLLAPEIYECLEVEQEYNVASDILSICMGNLSLNDSELPRLLQRALNHDRAIILALNAIVKELRKTEDSSQVHITDELLGHVLRALGRDETEVGVPALNILKIVLLNEAKLRQPLVKDALMQMLNASDVVKCRIYELAVHLGKKSPAMLENVEYLLDKALSELDNDDVLLQVNILEIMVALAEQNHGLIYLEKRQVFEIISRRVENIDKNPLDRLLIPGIMKFFGKVACIQPQKIITGYPHMIRCLFECLHTADSTLLPASFDTMGEFKAIFFFLIFIL